MSYSNVLVFFSVAQIALQLGAAYFAYKLIKMTGTFRAWVLVIIAFVLMAFRRTTALLITMGTIPELIGTIGMVDRLALPLVISICLIWGMYELFKIFLKWQKKK